MSLKQFQNLSVARKMWALFLGLLLCCVLVAGGLFVYLQNVEQRVSAAVQATDKRINLALRWQALKQMLLRWQMQARHLFGHQTIFGKWYRKCHRL